MPRNLPPRFQSHIARARRMRVIGGTLLGLCLLAGTAAALGRPVLAQLPHQAAATLKPIASDLRDTLSQLPSALSERIPKFDPQLPSAANQLAASATSFPQHVIEKIRNLFCIWLTCEGAIEVVQQPPQKTPPSYADTLPQINSPARSATTSQVVVSNSPPPSSASSPSTPKPTQQTVINQPTIERVRETVRTIVQGGVDEAFVDARLAALSSDLTARMNSLSSTNSAQTTNVYNTVSAALRIEELSDLILHNPIIDGGSISGTSISGTISASPICSARGR